jgi:hypothetical protein
VTTLITLWSEQGPTVNGRVGPFEFANGICEPVASDQALAAGWLGLRMCPYEPGAAVREWVCVEGRWSPSLQSATRTPALSPPALARGLPPLDPEALPQRLPEGYQKIYKRYDPRTWELRRA